MECLSHYIDNFTLQDISSVPNHLYGDFTVKPDTLAEIKKMIPNFDPISTADTGFSYGK
jgi:hypothetical protein